MPLDMTRMEDDMSKPKRWALHIGLKSEYTDSESLRPEVERYDGTVVYLGDLLNEDGHNTKDTSIDIGLDTETLIIAGSWQDWAEPEAEDVDDFHVVAYSETPWSKAAIQRALSLVRRSLKVGRTFDYVITDDGDVWGEHATVWVDDGQTLYATTGAGGAPVNERHQRG